jgi:hypothetical protein
LLRKEIPLAEVAKVPVITGIHPLQGPIAGGTQVTLEGRYFLPGVLVRMGDLLLEYVSRCSLHNAVNSHTSTSVDLFFC